jgi:hypothetical protein
MKVCPYCGKEPTVARLGPRQFIARCECGAYAAFDTPVGIRPAVMRLRKTALQQWDLMVHRTGSELSEGIFVKGVNDAS